MFLKDYLIRAIWKRRGVKLSSGTRLESKVEIDFGTRVNGALTVKGKGACRIGRYCALGADIRIITSNHLVSYVNIQCSLQRRIGANELDIVKGDVEIGNNVWIGDSVVILSGVRIGDGAVIGAGAVVTRDVCNYGVCVGVPAEVRSLRFDESICQQLDEIAWWHWDEAKMLRNREFFGLDLATADKGMDIKALIHD